MYYVLLYDYVENIVERRAPFRAQHLALANGLVEQGELVLGGALADPPDGAVIVFRTADASAVEDFVRKDPYVANGLVTRWRIRPWNVVVGCEAGPP
jgi:uncharacterized protein YciI